MHEVILKQFEHPDEIRVFEKGKFELVHIGGMTIGRASYDPGYSSFGIAINRKHGLKWLFHQEKATFHCAQKSTCIPKLI